MSDPIYSEGVSYGRNADKANLDDTRYVRCWNCGQISHLDRDRRAPVGSHAGDGLTGNDDADVSSGCRFCGSLRYDIEP